LSLAMAGVLACWRWLQGSWLNLTNLSPATAGEDACGPSTEVVVSIRRTTKGTG
jgi:hypothetical protein